MSYSANDNQNFFVQNGRTTSRVVAQPGGQCSISLGGWTAEELERQRQQREQRESGASKKEEVAESKAGAVVVEDKENEVENQKVETPEPTVAKDTQPKKEEAATNPAAPTSKPGLSSNAFASSGTTNSYNVITDRPTSRVSMPPGGHSNLRLW